MRIGVTQRVEYVSGYNEVRDCLDQRWSEFFDRLELSLVPIPNNLQKVGDWLEDMQCDGYLLTGGNDLSSLENSKNSSSLRDVTETSVLSYAESRAVPVIGVCRGLQIMNSYLGGKLSRVSGHTATRHTVTMCFNPRDPYTDRDVLSFHDWGVAAGDLAKTLIPCGYDEKKNIEAARHRHLPWIGMMWHPEREERFDAADLEIFDTHFRRSSS